MTVFRNLLIAGTAICWAGAAQAGLKVCNETPDVQAVSIGYEGTEDWTSEGWWNADPGACVTVIAADLNQQFYYYRAEVNGGDFDGESYFFCTDPNEYTIVGDAECEARGHVREAFREIDVGKGNTEFTLTLAAAAGAPAAAETPVDAADLGLKICNQTAFVQGVSIGYEGDEGFTSEGWWNVQPDECATVLVGELQKQYYYYRAEIDGGDFAAGTVTFCTSPQEYTIIGQQDCAARGHDGEMFAEIDTGETAKGFTLTLVSDAASASPEATPAQTATTPATSSGLEFCNKTADIQALSIGYEGADGADWTSEGWWNVDPGACSKVISTDLTEQYYYYRAEVNGGDFAGGGYFFCTSPQEYTIVGDTDCEGRGYVREDFAEINVGRGNTGFTHTIGSADAAPAPEAVPDAVVEATPDAPEPSADGLRICNATAATQGLSVGYQDGEIWTSEGWWNLETDQCATVLTGELQKRYYYYRAEVDGGPFDGGDFSFCTSPSEYTITGDTDCEERGYVTEKFAEIDTGPTAKSFVFTISDTGAPAEAEPELFEEPAPDTKSVPDQVPSAEVPTPKEPEPAPEPEAVPEAAPEPEPMPEAVPDPMAEPEFVPEQEEPATPRRGGSRGG